MSILDKYAREPANEKKTESVGSRLEPSLYNAFVEHCQKRGLTTSAAIRYMVIELLQDEESTDVNIGYQKKTNEVNKVSRSKQESSLTISRKPRGPLFLTNDNDVLQNIDFTKKKKSKRGQAKSIKQWTIDNLVPCPVCDPPNWITRTNYARHVKKHGYQNGYDLIQDNLDKVEEMVKEKSL